MHDRELDRQEWPWLPQPPMDATCAACRDLRQDDVSAADESAATDARVLLRRHYATEHGRETR